LPRGVAERGWCQVLQRDAEHELADDAEGRDRRRGAAVVDPDIAALWERIQRRFHATQRAIG